MSASENSGNNQGPILAPSIAKQTYTRDAKYYYYDGNTTFLAGDVLFKFQASILAPDEDSEVYEFEPLMKPLHDLLCLPAPNIEGSSDTNPIVVPGVEAEQFRDLLLTLLGRPENPAYMAFLRGIQHGSGRDRDMLVRFADLSDLALRFGMRALSLWGLSQLLPLLKSRDLANYAWDKKILCKMLSCLSAHPSIGDHSEILDFILTILSISIENPPTPQDSLTPILNTCVHWYKNLSPSSHIMPERTIFGYVFALILSLGHRSAVWTDNLTRADRLILYAAQAHLTCLKQDIVVDLGWIYNPRGYYIGNTACLTCGKQLDSVWDASFGLCGPLSSYMPLEDVTKLVQLPKYRQAFANIVLSENWERLCEGEDEGEGEGERCGAMMLGVVDGCIEKSFWSLAGKYNYFATSFTLGVGSDIYIAPIRTSSRAEKYYQAPSLWPRAKYQTPLLGRSPTW
ncbi:hypothetical protein BDV93DRAFT_547508 [Ceratobasidium sp. AG-I]|nr:hypothetical protein BDV93DRAFT_547508 [Ceratobasidium sp. AG-I]